MHPPRCVLIATSDYDPEEIHSWDQLTLTFSDIVADLCRAFQSYGLKQLAGIAYI